MTPDNMLGPPGTLKGDPWQDRAACTATDVDPEWFFPSTPLDEKRALAVCAECPVVKECAESRHTTHEGIYGGKRYDSNGRVSHHIPPPLSARREAVREARLSGVGNVQIASDLGVPLTTIHKDVEALRKAGLLPKSNRSGKREGWDQIAQLHRAGLTAAEIAREVGIHRDSVQRIRRIMREERLIS